MSSRRKLKFRIFYAQADRGEDALFSNPWDAAIHAFLEGADRVVQLSVPPRLVYDCETGSYLSPKEVEW